jgi:hypothetical protein
MSALQRQPIGHRQVPPPLAPQRSGLLQRKCACGGTRGPTGECVECRRKQQWQQGSSIQTKLRVNTPDDRYEREADYVAEQVMRMPRSYVTRHVDEAGGALLQAIRVGRRSAGEGAGTDAPEVVYEVLRSPGKPLDAETRAFFEPAFDRDFGDVRIHVDAKAAQSAQVVGARAFTVGRDVAFGPSEFAPTCASGKRLLAHELTHVVQRHTRTSGSVVRRQSGSVGTGAPSVSTLVPIPTSATGARTNSHSSKDLLLQRNEDPSTSPSSSQVVYICSKDLERSPLGKHAFFRFGGSRKGNPTVSLEPMDTSLGAGCWQGVPDRNYPSDVNADAACESTQISAACVYRETASYPIGHYCAWGPNSNTFVGSVAESCGYTNPDPPGWTPGIDASPPPSGTYAPEPLDTLMGCMTKICIIGVGPPRRPENIA